MQEIGLGDGGGQEEGERGGEVESGRKEEGMG